MCIINCSGACQVAILTHIHDDGYIPCTHATRSTRDLQPSVRAPDTRTAPTSAYLSNYRYRAHRTYPGDPAGRQSGASITDYIPERWRKIGIGNEVKVVRGPPGAQTVAPRACESTRADLSRRILRTCDPSYQTCAPATTATYTENTGMHLPREPHCPMPYGPSKLTALTSIRVRTRERILGLGATRWASAVVDYWETMQPCPLVVHPICENVTQGKAGD